MKIFRIPEIKIDTDGGGLRFSCYAEQIVTVSHVATVYGTLEISCNQHGNLISRLNMRAQKTHRSAREALRKALQAILDFDFEFRQEIPFPKCDCSLPPDIIQNEKIVYDFSNHTPDVQDLLKSLFTNSTQGWKMPTKEIEN